jgi:hypothetical protein
VPEDKHFPKLCSAVRRRSTITVSIGNSSAADKVRGCILPIPFASYQERGVSRNVNTQAQKDWRMADHLSTVVTG